MKMFKILIIFSAAQKKFQKMQRRIKSSFQERTVSKVTAILINGFWSWRAIGIGSPVISINFDRLWVSNEKDAKESALQDWLIAVELIAFLRGDRGDVEWWEFQIWRIGTCGDRGERKRDRGERKKDRGVDWGIFRVN
jgi:hypothetical protein